MAYKPTVRKNGVKMITVNKPFHLYADDICGYLVYAIGHDFFVWGEDNKVDEFKEHVSKMTKTQIIDQITYSLGHYYENNRMEDLEECILGIITEKFGF